MQDRYRIYFVLCIIILGAAAVESKDLFSQEQIYGGYNNTVKQKILPNCSYTDIPYTRNVPSWYLVCLSDLTLDNARILPFVASIGILPMVFLVTREITKNPVLGLIATAGTAINPIFLIFNDSSAYNQFWVLFLLGSIYAGYRKPILAVPLFVLSVVTKPLVLAMFPAIMYLFWSNRKLTLSYGLAGGMLTGVTMFMSTVIHDPIVATITPPDVVGGADNVYWSLTKHTTHLYAGALILASILMAVRRDSTSIKCLVFLGCFIGGSLLLSVFTIHSAFPYRMMPVVIFGNIGMAHIILKNNRITERLTKSFISH